MKIDQYVFFVMEYCSRGELFDLIISRKFVPEADAKVLFAEIVTAVLVRFILFLCFKPKQFSFISLSFLLSLSPQTGVPPQQLCAPVLPHKCNA